jgi:hypothetical protein
VAEFTETFDAGLESAFDVTITGEWLLKGNSNPFTGAPTTAIEVLPEKIMYGSKTAKAEGWASLGPIMLVDVLYLTDELQITRGVANTESIFVWRRIYPSKKK